MADKRPLIHPFFTVKKKKQTESTEVTEPTADLSASINNCNDVNIEENPDRYTSLIIVDDELEEDVSSSFVNDQSEKLLSKCDLVCCTSSKVILRLEKRFTWAPPTQSQQIHSECLYVVQQQSKPSILVQIDTVTKQQQEQRRRLFMAEVSSLQYLLRQGIALRGRSENEGNLFQLMLLRSVDITGLDQWLHDKKYLSHDIVNELAKEMALIILRNLCIEISNKPFFALICDESTDESGKTQLSISIRSVDECFGIHEDCLGLYELESQDAKHIATVILDVLIRCNLNVEACRGQAYDGAATMSGVHGGVVVYILQRQKKAFFVHCNAHCLDLALQDLTKVSITINVALNITKDIVNFVRRSPKRLNIAEKLSFDLCITSSQLKPLCPTRWTVRASSMNSLLANHHLIQSVMKELVEQKGESGVKAAGWLNQMENFQTFFGLKLGHVIFVATEELSCSLQRIDNCLHDVLCAVNVLISYFTRIRSNEYFETFYSKVVTEAEFLTDETRLPRVRRPPNRFVTDTTLIPEVSENCTELYRKQYQNVIDEVLKALNNRFKQSIFPLLCQVQEFIIVVANGSCASTIDKFCAEIQAFIVDDINCERLKQECAMVPDFFRTVIDNKEMGIKKVTKISTIIDVLNVEPIGKTMFHQFNQLLRLYLTVPVTTATAERSFSVMNRMKTCLRSTMTPTRLNSVFLTHIYKEKTDSIDLRSLCSTFASKNEQRKLFFGIF
ncbi:unnamed protein product [Rotaria magnacalcarata]